jgi:hypothetical protein
MGGPSTGDIDVCRKDGRRTIVLRLDEACEGHTSVVMKNKWSGRLARTTTRVWGDDVELACVP